jgi:hypothetical protein
VTDDVSTVSNNSGSVAALGGRDVYETTYHTDGTVTLWDVYQQQWVRTDAPSDRLLASLDWRERERVLAHLGARE